MILPAEVWLIIAQSLSMQDIQTLILVFVHLTRLMRPKLAGHELVRMLATRAQETQILGYIQSMDRMELIDVAVRDEKDRTALHYASQFGYITVLQYLVATPLGRAQLNVREKYHNDTAIILASRRGFQHVVEILVRAGGCAHLQNKHGESLLYWAILNYHLPLTRFALDIGISISRRLRQGMTPLSLALLNSQMKLVTLLIERGADTTQPDLYGTRPLGYAVSQGSLVAVKTLLEHGADPFQHHAGYKDCRMIGHTPFDLAVLNGDIAMVQLLLDYSTGLQQYESDHNSSLCVAVKRNDLPMVKLLLERGANVRGLSSCGRCPLHLAVKAERRIWPMVGDVPVASLFQHVSHERNGRA